MSWLIAQQALALRGLLSERWAWQQGHMATDDLGQVVDPKDPGAACWCVLGGVAKVSGCTNTDAASYAGLTGALRLTLVRALGLGPKDGCSVTAWNDAPERTHEDVISLIDATIMRESGLAGAMRGEGPCLEF